MEIYSQPFKVYIHQISVHGDAHLHSVFQWFQEAAANHASILGAGVEHLNKKGKLWALSRLSLEVMRLPEWKEELELKTWIPGSGGLASERHFSIESKSNNDILINGGSLWFALDRKSKRPVPLDDILGNAIINGERAIKAPIQKVVPGDLPDNYKEFSIPVRSGDIDIAGHVNNSIYVKWSIDALSLEELKNLKLDLFEINFIAEVLINNVVTIKRSDYPNQIYIEMSNQDGITVCKSRFSFSK